MLADDKSGKIVGFALDGFPVRGPTEPDGKAPVNLDAINGHDHDGLGYHYHASNSWPYFVSGFKGALGTATFGDANVCDATQQGAGGGPGRRGGPGAAKGGAKGKGPPKGGPPPPRPFNPFLPDFP